MTADEVRAMTTAVAEQLRMAEAFAVVLTDHDDVEWDVRDVLDALGVLGFMLVEAPEESNPASMAYAYACGETARNHHRRD